MATRMSVSKDGDGRCRIILSNTFGPTTEITISVSEAHWIARAILHEFDECRPTSPTDVHRDIKPEKP